MSEGVLLPSRAIFRVDKLELYKFEVANSGFATLIKSLLRSYGGIMDHYTKISEAQLAVQMKVSESEVIKQLNLLHKIRY